MKWTDAKDKYPVGGDVCNGCMHLMVLAGDETWREYGCNLRVLGFKCRAGERWECRSCW